MNLILNGWINRVFRVNIKGSIDQKLTDSVARGLQNSWPYKPTGIIVSINSHGGSIIQAQAIADLLRIQSNRHNIPIVTFVEDQCLGSANLLLTSGVKSYASAFSMIGDVGFSWSKLWMNRFAQQHNIKQEYVFSPEKKVKFNTFEQIKPESQAWIKKYLTEQEYELKVAITNNRSQQLTKKGQSKQLIEQNIFKAGIINPQRAIQFGFIDGIKSVDQELKDKYSSTKVYEVNKTKKDWKNRLSSFVAI